MSYEININYELEWYYGLDKISKYCFDLILVIIIYIYVEFYVKYIKLIIEIEMVC